MKKIIFLVGVLFLVLVTASYAKSKPQKQFAVISVKKHVLYFKVAKSFLGGMVEVYDSREKFMEADDLPHTHTMIYFDEMPKGSYTIRLRKGNLLAEFKYDNI
jgi:hypothetical protein